MSKNSDALDQNENSDSNSWREDGEHHHHRHGFGKHNYTPQKLGRSPKRPKPHLAMSVTVMPSSATAAKAT